MSAGGNGKQKTKGGGVAGKDSFQRINFLYQMATLMSQKDNPKLSAYYARVARLVGQKSVLRMEPEMKRKICKTCKQILIPGTSGAELEITGKDNVCEIRCTNCAAKKIFNVNPAYKMWLDDPRSIVETITCGTSTSSTKSSAGGGGGRPGQGVVTIEKDQVVKPDRTVIANKVNSTK